MFNNRLIKIMSFLLVFLLIFNILIVPVFANPLVLTILSQPEIWGLAALLLAYVGLDIGGNDILGVVEGYLSSLNTNSLNELILDASSLAYGLYAVSSSVFYDAVNYVESLEGFEANSNVYVPIISDMINPNSGVQTKDIVFPNGVSLVIEAYNYNSSARESILIDITSKDFGSFYRIYGDFYDSNSISIDEQYLDIDKTIDPDYPDVSHYNITNNGYEISVYGIIYDDGYGIPAVFEGFDVPYPYSLNGDEVFDSATGIDEIEIPTFPDIPDTIPDVLYPELPGDYIYIDEEGIVHEIKFVPDEELPPEEPKRLIGFPLPRKNDFFDEEDLIQELDDLDGYEEIDWGYGEVVDPDFIPEKMDDPDPFLDPGDNPFPDHGDSPFPDAGGDPETFIGTMKSTTIYTDPDSEKIMESETTFSEVVTDIITDSKIDPDTGERIKNEIDFTPLLLNAELLTFKFPFSLPFDIFRAFNSIVVGDEFETPYFCFDVEVPALDYDIEFCFDLEMWDPLAVIVRFLVVFVFTLSLVLATRRLMGGSV